MGKVRSNPHPSGKKGGRNKRFFPQLIGFAHAIQRVIEESPTSNQPRTAAQISADVSERQAKRAAKLARRAKLANPSPKE